MASENLKNYFFMPNNVFLKGIVSPVIFTIKLLLLFNFLNIQAQITLTFKQYHVRVICA